VEVGNHLSFLFVFIRDFIDDRLSNFRSNGRSRKRKAAESDLDEK
jgi:hypothetical protein